jgi:anti-anti-sigma factor
VNGAADTLRQAVYSQSDVSTVVLDLSRVSIVDARGLGVMLELREQVQAKGIGFRLINVSRLVGRLLAITRLDSVFEITSGVEFFPALSRRRPASVVRLASCA